ncbi:LytR/AlgR family response regulator transcription factor [Parabacteroides sp. APC149_11_2_Y6]|jgi:two-component system response regulator
MDTKEKNYIIPDCHVDDGFFVRTGEFHSKILYKDILWVSASSNYTDIHLLNGKAICVIYPLVKVEAFLPATLFIRIHRSHIINIRAVDRFIGNILYIGKQRLDISRPYRKLVFSCFDILEERKRPFTGETE